MAQIRCSRCHKKAIVEPNYKLKECPSCHNRTVRKSAHMTETQLENLAVKRLIDFESAWQKYKRFCHTWKSKPKPKAEYELEWMAQQKPRIANIKNVISKYGAEFPLQGAICLQFRSMLSQRNTPTFSPDLELLSHIPKCQSCNSYYVKHRHNSEIPLVQTDDEGYVSEKNFNSAIDDFFSVILPKKDQIEEWEQNQGLTDVCIHCGREFLPDGRCPNHCEMY